MPRKLNTSPLGRLLRVGAVATRVSTSLALEKALGFALASPVARLRRTQNFVANAVRVTEALGELKGAAMKVGQILSVHEGLLPPEVCAVLQTLQRDAPPVPFASMRAQLEGGVPGGLERFAELATEPLAAASIGQVYRGRLKDGREVAVKVQYPDIDRVVEADLKNLKKLVGALVAMVIDIDFEPFWLELRERLLEELDYEQEASNIARMAALYADDPMVIVPRVLLEMSGKHVLTMVYEPGIKPDDACSDRYDAALRDAWGARHLTFVMRGLIEHRFLHADPNFGNFAFRENGAMVVYDHGCVTAVEPAVAEGCAGVLAACVAQDVDALTAAFRALGVYNRQTGEAVALDAIAPIAQELLDIVGPEPYRFSDASTLYATVLDPRGAFLRELTRLELPPELMFVNRTLSGVFGNLCRLRSRARWSEVLAAYLPDGPVSRRAVVAQRAALGTR
ncbi:MAG: AarF/ABC1/UbiB kinase family protein [Pseudomonadota bacterium]